ncbi:hypothetical protein J7I98_13865 [Streptomyces sp. ISL-98]|uniref:DUF6571 family protein n=1 Tax=Streptomyces sp. ISL-98 TaxID=2819192 RepID=UPI001BEA324F|nr:DUF6571 family protein [Streptomyces sp. ISL-98]MBT2506957.1 hypothetical protein [Streptomyces sp. ISL-98]
MTDLRLGKLKAAVTDWEQMVGKLRALATGGGGGINAADLKAKAEAADWSGANATVTKGFVAKTASEFNDVVTEARSVHKILQESHAAFKKHQEELKTTVDRWAKRNVYINDKGGAVSAAPPGAVAGNAKTEAPTQEDVDAAAAEVGRILEAANETDRITARALRKHAASKYDFDETGYRGLKDADRQQGIEDADAQVKLAAKGADLTDAELKRFNEVAKNQRDNPAYAERFATKLGPEGTLQFWRSLADPGRGDTPTGERAKILAKVQDNLSLTLATATHVDTPAMREWKDGIIAAGDDRIKHPGIMSAPHGFQVMSSLMGKGKFESGFLTSYGKEMVEFERGNSKLGADWLWDGPGNPAQLNYPPGSAKPGNDPVAGFMEALGHNPEASLKFFNDSTGRGGKDDLDTLSNWDYLVDKENENAREWPTDDDGKTTGYKNLGHALESATLGYAYDDQNPSIPPLDTDEQKAARDDRTALMQRVVDNYKNADVIDGQPGIRDSLTNMAAGHVDSLNYSMANFGGSGEQAGRDGMFDAKGNHLRDFGQTDGANFLRALASDEDSYKTLSAAQQVYGASAMGAQGDDLQDALRVGRHSVLMHGLMDEARFESIGKEFGDEKDERNKELEKQAEWRKAAVGAVVGTAVGAGTALIVPAGAAMAIAVPLAMENVGGAANAQFATETIDWLKEREFDNSNESIESIGKAKEVGQHNAMTPLLNYADAHGMDSDAVWDLAEKASVRYGVGAGVTDTEDSK